MRPRLLAAATSCLTGSAHRWLRQRTCVAARKSAGGTRTHVHRELRHGRQLHTRSRRTGKPGIGVDCHQLHIQWRSPSQQTTSVATAAFVVDYDRPEGGHC